MLTSQGKAFALSMQKALFKRNICSFFHFPLPPHLLFRARTIHHFYFTRYSPSPVVVFRGTANFL